MDAKTTERLARKPEDSAFQQQRLPAWQPILTPEWVIYSFLIVAIAFIPIGIGIIVASNEVQEITFRYDQYQPSYQVISAQASNTSAPASSLACNVAYDVNGNPTPFDAATIASLPTTNANLYTDYTPSSRHNVPNCFQSFDVVIPAKMTPPIFFYYRLTNYYQNHRQYTTSRSDYQLEGENSPDLTDCTPLTTDKNGATLYPCGLISSSFFNDTFGASLNRGGTSGTEQWVLLGNNTATQPGGVYVQSNNWNKEGIAWSTDVSTRFLLNDATVDALDSPAGTTQFTRIASLPSATGYVMPLPTDEDLIVWMKAAGLPTFKKLYRKIQDTEFDQGEVIRVFINNVYNVSSFGGTKSFVFSTVTTLGGKNTFLGWTFIVVGIVCAVLSGLFAVKHKISPRAQGDMKYFHWQGGVNGNAGGGGGRVGSMMGATGSTQERSGHGVNVNVVAGSGSGVGGVKGASRISNNRS